jgi:hypothetical protein
MSKSLGILLRVIHILLAVAAFGLTVFGPVTWLPYVSIFWLALLTMYVVNRGCFLTQLEMYLTGEDVTIVDPLLHFFNLPIKKHTRNTITMLGGIFMLFMAILRGR